MTRSREAIMYIVIDKIFIKIEQRKNLLTGIVAVGSKFKKSLNSSIMLRDH